MERFYLKLMLCLLIFGGYLGVSFVASHTLCEGVRALTAEAVRNVNKTWEDMEYLAQGRDLPPEWACSTPAPAPTPSPTMPLEAPAPLLGAILFTGRRRDQYLGHPLGWSDDYDFPRVYFATRRQARLSLARRGLPQSAARFYFEREAVGEIPKVPTGPGELGFLCRLAGWGNNISTFHIHGGWISVGEDNRLELRDCALKELFFYTSPVVEAEELGAGGWMFRTESGSVYWVQLNSPTWEEQVLSKAKQIAEAVLSRLSSWAEMEELSKKTEANYWRIARGTSDPGELLTEAEAWRISLHFVPTSR